MLILDNLEIFLFSVDFIENVPQYDVFVRKQEMMDGTLFSWSEGGYGF